MSRVADRFLRTLEAHGVEHVFGVCGDTSVGLYRTLAAGEFDFTHVLARDERAASFMADAYARLSDRPGVCEGPSGGGATYLLPGLAEATDSSVPVVAFNTDVPVEHRGRGVLTELDQERLFEPVTKWSAGVDAASQALRLVREAFRRATTGRPGAVHLSLPMDVLAAEAAGESDADPDTTRYPAYRPPPAQSRVEAAADLLAASARPVIVAGGGVHSARAWTELRRFAEQRGIPVAQTLTSVGCIGDSPYSVGVVGENGARAYANEMLEAADAVFLVGTAVESVWTRTWTVPTDDQEIVHADIDPERIGRNYRPSVGVPGDLRETLRALARRMDAAEAWDAAAIEARFEEWVAPYAARFEDDSFPVRPERLVADAAAVLDSDATLVSDPGTSCPYFAALYPFTEPGRHWVTPRAHGGLGYAIPAAAGARFARPDGQIVAFTGDGSVGMSAGDLETLSRYDLSVTVVVVSNDSFSWIEAGQRNHASFSFGVDFQSLDYATIAEAFGVAGFRVTSADEYRPALEAALETDGPALVDVPTQPIANVDDPPVDWLEPDP